MHRYDTDHDAEGLGELLRDVAPGLVPRSRAVAGFKGQRFFIGPGGLPDLRVNACLGSARWRNLGQRSYRDYTYSLGVWLNFLVALGVEWWEAEEDDAEEFLFWRVTDPANECTVETNSFARDLAALKKFYRWMSRYGVRNPFEDFEAPRIRRHEDVKWLDPGAYKRWRDLGLRGLDVDGRADGWWRGRNAERDVAFSDALYGNGLRVSEWASVVLPELPSYDPRRGYYTCHLADACAKGGYGHLYWTPRSAMKTVLAYCEGARAAAVRRAQDAGRYERVGGRRLVTATHGTQTVTLEMLRGGVESRPWNVIGPRTRLRLFRQTRQGLEPLALWLNEDGLPRDGRGWEHTFEGANDRIERLGLEGFTCTAHMLRHSCALKWFAIGKLVYSARLGHLGQGERFDFREQFGDTWHLVQTMLGHRRVETTKNVYLEPFRSLEVETLLAHADGFPVDRFLADAFAGHPRVRTDPLRAAV
ncbi:site-specific integrase [Streptomyces rimosus]|uniref:site-specific integrase n=1 Tax=Streptomyces rimosus TaxID=1927 RepID=UPI000B1679F7|nr:site-specific integrase [Streptomyces rimosus]